MSKAKVAFIVYGVHKDGLTDPMETTSGTRMILEKVNAK